MTAEYFLAVALLMAPPGTMEPPPCPQLDGPLRSALKAVALEWEILDPRETKYTLTKAEDFQVDLDMLRGRYQEFKNAPSLTDCERFPDRDTITELLTLNRKYRDWIDASKAVHIARRTEVPDVVKETDYLYTIWETVRDARCIYYSVATRRRALVRLRDLLGEEAYHNADLPPFVPLWRFQAID